jgi:hypothetical protein
MKLILAVLATICIAENAVAIPHEKEIVGSDECDADDSGAEYIATFNSDVFVHNTIITIPESSVAADFVDVEVFLDHPKYKVRPGKPIRCGKKFSRVAARKLKSSEIIFVCKGAGKTAALGRVATDARVFIKKRVKKGTTRCLDFSGLQFITIQEDVEVWSDWSEWSECEDDQVTRTRTCSGIFCETDLETEAKDEPCLKCEEGFEPNDDAIDCVDIDECELGRCPEDSECTNSIGSYICKCNEGMYGDDMNFCIAPRACHNGGQGVGCACSLLVLNTTEFVTSWNNTAGECTVEYMINFDQASVHSWYAALDFENEVAIVDIWRARAALTSYGYSHGLETMDFNVEQVMEMRFHANFMTDCSFVYGEVPTVTLCTESVPITTTAAAAPTTTPTPTTTTQPPATEEPVLQLSEETCEAVSLDVQGSWQNVDGSTITQVKIQVDATGEAHEWRIELPFDDTTTIVTWTAETSLAKTWTLTAKDYNAVLQGSQRLTMQVTGAVVYDDDGALRSGSFCYKSLI